MPGLGSLLDETWRFFTSTWNTTIKTSIIFLYAGIAIFLVALLTRYSSMLLPLNGVTYLVSLVVILWATIRLTLMVLRLDEKKKPDSPEKESKAAWSLLLPFFWINILVGLIVFGGTILLILPGIYLAVSLSMADIILLDRDTRGSKALSESRELIRGRWWATFGRFLGGMLVLGLAMTIATGILGWIVNAIAGPGFLAGETVNIMAYGVTEFIQMAMLAVFMPLLIGFQVKLYTALKNTR